MPSAHLPRSLGGISAAFRYRWWIRAALRETMLLAARHDAEPLAAALDPASVGQLARHRLAARHGDHAFDAGGVGRIAVEHQPTTDRPPRDRSRSIRDGQRVGRV